MLGKSPMKWRQRLDMTFAVDWDVKHQFKQTNDLKPGATILDRITLRVADGAKNGHAL